MLSFLLFFNKKLSYNDYMKKSSKIKLTLLIFFIIFFGFIFWYFYEPSQVLDKNGEPIQDSPNSNLFPFGDNTNTTDNNANNTTSSQNNTVVNNYIKEKIEKLRQISMIPVAGVIMDPITKKELHEINVKNDIFDTKDAFVFDDHISEIRFVAKKNGNIYSTYTNTNKIKRISNTTIPKVYEASFWDKNNLIIRYLNEQTKDIKTYSIKLRKKSEAELEEERKIQGDDKIKGNTDLLNFSGVFLPLNIEEYSLAPNSNRIFYLRKEGNKTIGVISESLGENKIQIFGSELNELNVNWNNTKNILLNTKASSNTYTLSFKLNSVNGQLEKLENILWAGNGLPNNDFSKILYSAKNDKGNFTLYSYDVATSNLKPLGFQTLVEKCVWSSDNINIFCAVPNNGVKSSEPDMWYKGYTDFSDSIFMINTNNLNNTLVLDSMAENKNFDIVNMKLDYYEDYIYFIDSMTGFAWLYNISDITHKNVTNSGDKYSLLTSGKECPSNQILNENLRSGDRNGKYSSWAKKTITEAKILQEHMNRLGFNAGVVDGILGPNTDGAIKRMQKFLGTYQDGMVGPITRGLINNSCE